MPPVLGPVSPSPTRLWSCAGRAAAHACRRRGRRSSPPRPPGIPRPRARRRPRRSAAPTIASSIAASASATSGRDRHALAGGQAVGLDDDRRAAPADEGLGLGGIAEAAVGGGRDAVFGAEILGEALGAFERGGGRASGRRRAMPAASSRSTSPATSGASGPTTTKSMRSRRAKATMPLDIRRGDRRRRSLPRRCRHCPGRRKRSHSGEAAIAQHSACSRPPEPITRTRMSRSRRVGSGTMPLPRRFPRRRGVLYHRRP